MVFSLCRCCVLCLISCDSCSCITDALLEGTPRTSPQFRDEEIMAFKSFLLYIQLSVEQRCLWCHAHVQGLHGSVVSRSVDVKRSLHTVITNLPPTDLNVQHTRPLSTYEKLSEHLKKQFTEKLFVDLGNMMWLLLRQQLVSLAYHGDSS